MNQNGGPVPPDAAWGPIRIVYLQYASDRDYVFRLSRFLSPSCLDGCARGPDVSPELRWYPVVTMLQLALDMAVATATPMGYGHVYAPKHYVDAWAAIADVQDWSPGQLEALKQHLAVDDTEAESEPYDNRGG